MEDNIIEIFERVKYNWMPNFDSCARSCFNSDIKELIEVVYIKAIEDFKAECHKQISKNHEKYGFNRRDLVNLDLAEIDMIAEQLKVGEEYDD